MVRGGLAGQVIVGWGGQRAEVNVWGVLYMCENLKLIVIIVIRSIIATEIFKNPM